MTELEIVRAASAHYLDIWVEADKKLQSKPDSELLKARERAAWNKVKEIDAIVIKLEAKENAN